MSGERNLGLHSSSRYRDVTTDEELFDLTMTNLNDAFYGYAMDSTTDGTFKGVCLSGFVDNDNDGGSSHPLSGKRVGKKIVIIVRPFAEFSKPLPDPAKDDTTVKVLESITMHKVYKATSESDIEQGSGPKFGQVINCFWEEGSSRNSKNLRLKWFPIPGEKPRVLDAYRVLRTREDAATAIEAFKNGRPARVGLPLPDEDEYDRLPYDLANLYDSEDVPNKAQHKYFMQFMHPSFLPYAKAVIYEFYTVLGGTTTLASGFRTYAKQQAMVIEVANWRAANGPDAKNSKGKNLPEGYGGAPAAPGTSKHNFGTACDFSVVINKKNYNSKDSTKEEWIASGIPRIINSFSLRWGGTFGGNYDPIHFDMPLSKKTVQNINKKAKTIPYENNETKAALATIEAISSVQLVRQANYPNKRPWLTTKVIPLDKPSSNYASEKQDELAALLEKYPVGEGTYNNREGRFQVDSNAAGIKKLYFYPNTDQDGNPATATDKIKVIN